MKNNIKLKYFLVSLKKSIPFSLFSLIVFGLTYLIPLIIEYIPYNYVEGNSYNLSTNYGWLVAALAIYSFLLPTRCFSYLTRKRKIDTFYSLPIKRKDIAIINILTCIVSTLIPFTLIYFTGSIITLVIFPAFNYWYYIIWYLLIVVLFVSNFLFNSFFFTRTNKISDGVITMIFANFAASLALITLAYLFDIDFNEIEMLIYSLIPFVSFIKYGNYFNNLIIGKYEYHDYKLTCYRRGTNPLQYEEWFKSQLNKFEPIYLIILLSIVIICIILFIVLSKKRKPEDAEEISKSKFGLPVLSPLVFTCLTIILANASNTLSGILIFSFLSICYLGITVVELKTFKIPLYKILMLVGMFIIVIIG